MDSSLRIEHKLKSARLFEAQGKPLHALQIYTSLIEEFPEHADTYCCLAELYEALNKIESSISLLKSFLAENPENKEVRLFLGQFLLRNSRWEQAIEFLEYFLPEEEPMAAFFLGFSYFMLKDYERAKISFINFIAVEKQTELLHEAHIYLAKIEIQLKNFESALSFAQKANVIYSNFWELNLIFAITYYNLGMYAHAVVPAEKAVKLSPQEPSPYEWAGKVYSKLGEYTKAEEKFLKYIELIEDATSDIYARLAEVCLKIKKPKDALAYFDVALKLDPQNKTAMQGKQNASNIINGIVNDG
ncbi:MAG: tetratricopeptide repeat protein [Ignavibacteriaceae bacterium]